MSALFRFTESFLEALNGPGQMVFARRLEDVPSSPTSQPRPSDKKLLLFQVLFHLKRAKKPTLGRSGEKCLIFPIIGKRRRHVSKLTNSRTNFAPTLTALLTAAKGGDSWGVQQQTTG